MKLYNLRMKYGTHSMSDGDGGGGDGGDGDKGGTGSWRDALPDDIANDKGLADFKDIGGMAKAYLDTKSDLGRSIRIPGPDATAETIAAFNTSLAEKVPGLTAIPGEEAGEEELNAFFGRLGKPSEPSKYAMPDDVPEDLKDNMNGLAKMAFENNLTQAQFKRISEQMLADHNAIADNLKSSQADEYDKLKLDWGSALQPKSQAILELAKQTGAPEQLVEGITNRQIDMATMKWLDGLVEQLSGEGSQMNFQGGGSTDSRVTPAEAKLQIEEIMAKPEYWDSANPQQAGLVQKVVDLGKIASSAA